MGSDGSSPRGCLSRRSLLQAAAGLAFFSERRSDPSVRNAHGWEFDGQRLLLFGGADARVVRGDTWGWTPSGWTRLATAGPPPRTFPAMARDRSRGLVYLFGGNRVLFGKAPDQASFLGDCWCWNGSVWAEISGPHPPARAEASLTFDAARERLVLFGGYIYSEGANRSFGDTWEWDGRAWAQVGDGGPSARHGAAAAYDERRSRTVLFGGNGPFGGDGPNGETWEWDGVGWTQAHTAAGVPGRFNCAMAFDRLRGRCVRFGGWDGRRRVDDLWEFDGSVWRRLQARGPRARNHAGLAFDEGRQSLVLFGGHDGDRVFGDLWELARNRWTVIVRRRPERRVENGH